jgi:hypothetical protein
LPPDARAALAEVKKVQRTRYPEAAKKNLISVNTFPCAMSKVFLAVFLEETGNAEKFDTARASARRKHDWTTTSPEGWGRQHRASGSS